MIREHMQVPSPPRAHLLCSLDPPGTCAAFWNPSLCGVASVAAPAHVTSRVFKNDM